MTASLQEKSSAYKKEETYELQPLIRENPPSFCTDQVAFRIQRAVNNTLLPALLRLIAEYAHAPTMFFSLSQLSPFVLTETVKIQLIHDVTSNRVTLSWGEYQTIVDALRKQQKDALSEELIAALFTNFKALMKKKNKIKEQLELISDAHSVVLVHASKKTQASFAKAFQRVQGEISEQRVLDIQKELEEMGLVSSKTNKTAQDPSCCVIT